MSEGGALLNMFIDELRLLAQLIERGEAKLLQSALNRIAHDPLLAVAVDVNRATPEGKVLLHLAVAANSIEMVDALLNHAPESSIVDARTGTPLKVSRADIQIVSADEARQPLLHAAVGVASRSGDISMFKHLLVRGADIEATDAQGKTVFDCMLSFGENDAGVMPLRRYAHENGLFIDPELAASKKVSKSAKTHGGKYKL